jgi:hypothetical protein
MSIEIQNNGCLAAVDSVTRSVQVTAVDSVTKSVQVTAADSVTNL